MPQADVDRIVESTETVRQREECIARIAAEVFAHLEDPAFVSAHLPGNMGATELRPHTWCVEGRVRAFVATLRDLVNSKLSGPPPATLSPEDIEMIAVALLQRTDRCTYRREVQVALTHMWLQSLPEAAAKLATLPEAPPPKPKI